MGALVLQGQPLDIYNGVQRAFFEENPIAVGAFSHILTGDLVVEANIPAYTSASSVFLDSPISTVPEPNTHLLALLGLCAAALGSRIRKRLV